jgi:D-alanyl-lipoteichoic acid acyltransferase DltB (MBOAT superfamily)
MPDSFFDWLEATRQIALGDPAHALVALAAYVIAASVVLRPSYDARVKTALFAVLNLAAVYVYFFSDLFAWPFPYDRTNALQFAAYTAFACAHWLLIDAIRRRPESTATYVAALAYPIAPLIVVKIETAWLLIGFSYMAFRMAQAALETRRDPSFKASFSAYAAFLFFPLTIPAGPISPFAYFSRGLGNGRAPSLVSLGRGLVRIALGYVMLRYLATVAYQMSFGGMWADGFRHGVGDLLIASYSSLAYLYFNFAGFTHIVIGAAALVGVPVKENFDSPVLSRSVKEFWTRWHITLSEFVRDLVYSPLAVTLARRFGPEHAVPAAIVSGMITFVIIGLWHGMSVGYLSFGLMHGVGFCSNLVFDALSTKLRKGRAKSLFAAPYWTALCWLLTMTYIALSMFVVEFDTAAEIREALAVFDLAW